MAAQHNWPRYYPEYGVWLKARRDLSSSYGVGTNTFGEPPVEEGYCKRNYPDKLYGASYHTRDGLVLHGEISWEETERYAVGKRSMERVKTMQVRKARPITIDDLDPSFISELEIEAGRVKEVRLGYHTKIDAETDGLRKLAIIQVKECLLNAHSDNARNECRSVLSLMGYESPLPDVHGPSAMVFSSPEIIVDSPFAILKGKL